MPGSLVIAGTPGREAVDSAITIPLRGRGGTTVAYTVVDREDAALAEHRWYQKWRADVQVSGVRERLGFFDNEQAAADACRVVREARMPFAVEGR